jgi:peptidoglycan/LPS O-acetylase OafA/YrhL
MEGAPSVRAGALPGLDTVRFLLAINVLLVHTTSDALFNPGFRPTAFFVLSGYVVSYRLLLETQTTGAINLRAFYRRRAWRLLPSYYAVVFVGAVILPLCGVTAPSPPALLSILLLAPQLLHAYHWPAGVLFPLWSIGVEQMFYAVFPLLLRRVPLVRVCLGVIAGWTLLSALAFALNSPLLPLLRVMRFECMAVGGLAAWLVVNRSRWLRLVYHRAAEITAIALALVGSVVPFAVPLADLILSVIIAVFLVNLSTHPQPQLRLEWRWSRAAGHLSYGLYLWHVPVFACLWQIMDGIPLLLATVVVSLLVAWISYEIIERPLRERGSLSRHKGASRPHPAVTMQNEFML